MTDRIEQIKRYGKLIRQDDQGYTIYYYDRAFYAVKEPITIIQAETETKLEILIKNHEAELRRFKPVEVIRVEDGIRGRLTSRVADAKDEVYFSFKDASGLSSHLKEPISTHRWEPEKALPKFVEVTPKNLQLLKDIEKEQEAIQSCEAAIEKLKRQLEKPVTQETINKAAGETKD